MLIEAMAALSTNDFHNTCRLCLSKQGKHRPIFETCYDDLGPLSSRILACLSFEIFQNDDLPKQICHRCESFINVWHYFKLECDIAQKKLKRWHISMYGAHDQENNAADGENFILREVVNIKLEPEDDCVDVCPSSISVVDCVRDQSNNLERGDHVSDLGIPDSDGTVEVGRDFIRGGLSQSGSDSVPFETQNELLESMNLVISETSSVAVNTSDLNKTGPLPLSIEDENDDESLVRLVIESESLDNLNDGLNDSSDDIQITYENYGNSEHTIVEVTLDDSSDGQIPLLPIDSGTVDMDITQEANMTLGLNISPKAVLSSSFVPVKREPMVGIQIKKEMQDSDEKSHANGNSFMTSHTEVSFQASSCPVDHRMNDISSDEYDPPITRGNIYPCTNCKMTFKSLEYLDAHVKQKHNVLEGGVSKLKRSTSAKHSNVNSQVYNYSTVHLPKISNELFDEATQYCKFCTRKFTKANFWRHMKAVHIKEDPFKCGVCRKIFPGRRELVTHRVRTVSKYCRAGHVPQVDQTNIITHPEVPRGQMGRYECKECSDLFVQLSFAKCHVRIHSGEKPFFCYKCNSKEFRLKKTALKHVSVCKGTANQDKPSLPTKGKVKLIASRHTRAAVLKCSVLKPSYGSEKSKCPKCGKVLGNSSGLSSHLRFCKKGLKRCLNCSKFFSRRNINQHSRVCSRKINQNNDDDQIDVSQAADIPTVEKATSIGTAPRKNSTITKIVNLSVRELGALHHDSNGKLISMACKLCDRVMGSRKSMWSHLLRHSAEAFRCPVCSLRARQLSTLKAHIAKSHEGYDYKMLEDSTQLDSTGAPPASEKSKAALKFSNFKSMKLKCDVCLKLFCSVASLNYHKQSHKKIKCTKCEITFPAAMEKSHICTAKVKVEPTQLLGEDGKKKVGGERDEIPAVQYTCHLCKKRFHTRKMLYQHKKMHIKMKIYKCKMCGNSYSDAGALQEHKQMQHAEELLKEKCAATEEEISKPCSSILPQPEPKKPWECSKCQKFYSYKDSLMRHMKLHKRAPGYTREGEAKAIEKSDAPGVIFCSLCSQRFKSLVSFLGHKGWHSRQLGGKLSPKNVEKLSATTLEGSVNKKRSSSTSSKSSSIVNTSDAQDPSFKCHLCFKKFTSQKNLTCHLTYHRKGLIKNRKSKMSNETITPVVALQNILPVPKDVRRCKVCFKSFLEDSSLTMHMKTHGLNNMDSVSDVKDSAVAVPKQEPMTCKLCHKEYRCQKSLKFHMMGHSGEKPFKCRSCSNQYSHPKALAKHEKERHTNPLRPFSCNRCNTSFMLKQDLLAHYEKCPH